MASQYKANLQLAKDSEDISENLVENASFVYRTVLIVNGIPGVITAAAEAYGKRSPFNSILKLSLIARKVKDWIENTPLGYQASLLWTFTSILDFVKAGLVDSTDLGTRLIKGEGTGGRGIVDLVMLKCRMKEFFLKEFVPTRDFKLAAKNSIPQVLRLPL